jgi:hypothetical protein
MGENMTEINNDELISERDKLRGEVARLQVSKETGVPPGLLARGSTEDECRAIAEEALAWRGTAPAAPPQATAAVSPYGVGADLSAGAGSVGFGDDDGAVSRWAA